MIKNLEKVMKKFESLNKLPKAIIKYGTWFSLLLLIIGTLMVCLNNTVLTYDSYFEFVAMSLVKTSFTILAEAIIGGLLIDFFINK